MARVTWSVTPASSRPLRLLWYASMAVWVGFAGLAVGLAGAVAVGALLAGEAGPALLVGVLLLVGGPLSLLYLWPMLTETDQRPAFLTPAPWARPGWLALGAVLVVGLVVLVPAAAVALFAVAISSAILAAFLRSEGEVDPQAGRLVTQGRAVGLDTLSGVSRVDLLWISVLRLHYSRGSATAMAPRLLVVPGALADRAVASIEDGIAVTTTTDANTRSSRAVRLALLVLGLGSLALGVAIHRAGPVPPAVALWGSGLFGLFGLLFLWLSAVE